MWLWCRYVDWLRRCHEQLDEDVQFIGQSKYLEEQDRTFYNKIRLRGETISCEAKDKAIAKIL